MWTLRVIGTGIGLVLVFIALLVVAVLTQAPRYARPALEHGASALLGAPVQVGALRARPTEGVVELSDVRIGNPPPFPQGDAVRVKSLTARADLPALAKGELKVSDVKITGCAVNLVYDPEHGTNLAALADLADRAKQATGQVGKVSVGEVNVTAGVRGKTAPSGFNLPSFSLPASSTQQSISTALSAVLGRMHREVQRKTGQPAEGSSRASS